MPKYCYQTETIFSTGKLIVSCQIVEKPCKKQNNFCQNLIFLKVLCNFSYSTLPEKTHGFQCSFAYIFVDLVL